MYVYVCVYVCVCVCECVKDFFPYRSKEKKYYITYDMDFRFVPSDPVGFDKLSHCD